MDKNMRVAMYYNNHDIRVEEIPIPAIHEGEILMKIHASGICGSDVMEWYRIKKAPLVLGHEIAGEVVETGPGVDKFKIGDRIVAAHHVPCNTCYYCLSGHHTACNTLRTTNFDPGGFAEYVRLPEINVDRGTHLIPDELDYPIATFHEPLGCILRAHRIAKLKPGQCVLVVGSGMAGLIHIHMARSSGAGKILAVDISPSRLKAALEFGADEAVFPSDDINERLRSMNRGRLADLVIECSGKKESIIKALNSIERGGTAMLFAPTGPDVSIPVSINDLFFRNDITLTTSYASAPYDSWLALEILRSGTLELEKMITHKLPLEKTQYGFELVTKAADSLKVIIEPHNYQ
jgi:L-iditol 2-dehydrogenase